MKFGYIVVDDNLWLTVDEHPVGNFSNNQGAMTLVLEKLSNANNCEWLQDRLNKSKEVCSLQKKVIIGMKAESQLFDILGLYD